MEINIEQNKDDIILLNENNNVDVASTFEACTEAANDICTVCDYCTPDSAEGDFCGLVDFSG